jgi:hypothetical protein
MSSASSRLYLSHFTLDGKPLEALSVRDDTLVYFSSSTLPKAVSGSLSRQGPAQAVKTLLFAHDVASLKDFEAPGATSDGASALLYCPAVLPLRPAEEQALRALLKARTDLFVLVFVPRDQVGALPASVPLLAFQTKAAFRQKPLFVWLYPLSAWILTAADTLAFVMFLSFRIGLSLLLVAWLVTLLGRVVCSRFFIHDEKVDALLFPWLSLLSVGPLVFEILFDAIQLYSLQNGDPFPTVTIPLYVYFLVFFFHTFLAFSLALATQKKKHVFFLAYQEDKKAALAALHLSEEDAVYTHFDFQSLLSIFHFQYWLGGLLRFHQASVSNGRWYFVSRADYEKAVAEGTVSSFVYFKKGSFVA